MSEELFLLILVGIAVLFVIALLISEKIK